jgi:7-keto-8-aminopelargonate synthetase-like enzyme
MSGVPAVVGGDRLLRRFYELADEARTRGLSRRILQDADLSEPAFITLDGQRLVNFSSCCYLGINTDPRLKEGAIDAVQRFGTSYSSSPAYSALPLYEELGDRLSRMTGAPVVLAPTTTLMHLAALPLLIRSGDTVLIDAYCHASVQSALEWVRGSGVQVQSLVHGDEEALKSAVRSAAEAAKGRVWYLADGVYSMFGDLAPFGVISSLLDEVPNLYVYIDDAHGFSWQGVNGRGSALDALGIRERLVVSFGLAKSFGTTGGGLTALDPGLVDLVELCGAPLSFGGPIPPAVLGAGIASANLHLSPEHSALRGMLIERIRLVDGLATELGIPLAAREASPIRYVELGSVESMFNVVEALKSDGFYLNGAMFPIVPQGHAGIRFTVSLSVSEAQTEQMMTYLARHLKRHGGESMVIDLREQERAANS